MVAKTKEVTHAAAEKAAEVKDAVVATATTVIDAVGEKVAEAKEAVENKASDIQKDLFGA